MRRLIILAEVALGLLFASCTKEEQRTLSVIPAPLKVELQQEVFSLNSETGLYIDASEGDKKILEDYLVASSMNLKPVIAWLAVTILSFPNMSFITRTSQYWFISSMCAVSRP